MRNTIFTSIGVFALATAIQPAAAADMPVKAPVSAPVVDSWSGFYIGGSLGGRWARNDWTVTSVAPSSPVAATVTQVPDRTFDDAALRVGGYVGYNWLVARSWIVGIEADVGWADTKQSANAVSAVAIGAFVITGFPVATVRETWDASVRGRLGTLITPNMLVFGTAGVAWQRVELSAVCPSFGAATSFCTLNHNESYSKTLKGWTAGAGVEQRLWGNWLARLEYRYADFETFSQLFFNSFGPGFDDRFTANLQLRTHTLNAGLAHKF